MTQTSQDTSADISRDAGQLPPSYRNLLIIQALALAARPLTATEINATLNLHRLGATSGTYLPDYYGEMAGINSGLGSDRLLVDWELGSHTVAALAEGRACPQSPGAFLPLTLPEDIEALTRDAPDQAEALRLTLRQELQAAFAAGRRIVDFDRNLRQYRLED